MNSRTIDVVTDWETVAAPDGYEGLHQLSDSEFSGAVSAGTTWAFFLNGRVVGVFEGGIGDFEDAPLTAYRAADPSLPLLFSMQERGGETRAKYYTNETPLSDADKTLESGGFTGYIELSENVLSGDYYVVYHGGKSMSAAFVGSSERLVSGDEAFEKAADEVGIYEVKDVDVELVEIPEPPDAGEEADEDPDADEAAEDPENADEGPDADAESAEPETASTPAAAAVTDDGVASAAGESDGADAGGDDPSADSRPAEAGDEPDPEAGRAESADEAAPEDPETDPSGADEATAATAESEPTSGPEVGATPEAEPSAGETEAGPAEPEGPAPPTTEGGAGVDGRAEAEATRSAGGAATGDADGVFSDEERWREARTIPSLDPSRSNGEASVQGDDAAPPTTRERTQRQRRAREARERAAARRERRGSQSKRSQSRSESDSGESERLRKRLSRARERLESLEAERDDLAEERDEFRERVAELEAAREKQRERIDDLEAERERLEAEVERLESELEAGAASVSDAPAETMSPDRALAGTNLFVRYDRKGEATLEHARNGKASREDVSENLRLEHHTTFETDGLVVDGRPYEEFLRDSTEYSFAEWVVTDLLYEIGETGNRSKLGGVFDAIPDIDRVELTGTVDLADGEDADRRDFDVIFRDKMGDPLFVADINASRNATTEAMVGSLVENTGTVAENAESLSAGFYVTESFYEPGALENVAEATGGGLLSRSNKLSYVKLSRKRGYHLCLVEARNGEFHLNVPDL